MAPYILFITIFLFSVNVASVQAADLSYQEVSIEREHQYEIQKWMSEQNIIGMKWIDDEQVRELKRTLPASLYDYQLRVIHPGVIVTMEYSSKRINLQIDEDQKVTKVYLG